MTELTNAMIAERMGWTKRDAASVLPGWTWVWVAPSGLTHYGELPDWLHDIGTAMRDVWPRLDTSYSLWITGWGDGTAWEFCDTDGYGDCSYFANTLEELATIICERWWAEQEGAGG